MNLPVDSGFFLIKDLHFNFDPKLNVRYILTKCKSELECYRVGREYFSQFLKRVSYEGGVDGRILLTVLKLSGSMDNVSVELPCSSYFKSNSPDDFILQSIPILTRMFQEGKLNHKVPFYLDGKKLNPVNAATYSILSYLTYLNYKFKDVINFRLIYRELFQTKDADPKSRFLRETQDRAVA